MATVSLAEYKNVFPQPELDAAYTMGRFEGRVAIVTGGASGIGRATVERFSNDGASVAIFDINDTFGFGLESELTAQGKKVKYYRIDVTDKDQCVQGVNKVADDNEGRVNYLVNCAVYFVMQGLDAKDEDWQKTMSVNVIGYSNMVQACYPHMEKDGKHCAVVNVSSISAHVAHGHGRWTYQAAKGAVHILSKCMALDLSAVGIRVNSVSPGWCWTPAIRRGHNGDREKFEAMRGPTCMTRKVIECSGVAAAIVFLCSKDASFIDGADLPVDGGYQAMGPEGLGEQSSFAGTS